MAGAQPLTGEPLAVDLINTRPGTGTGRTDLIATPENLRSWLALQPHRLTGTGAGRVAELSAADLDAVHTVREHLTAAIERARRGEQPPPAALRGLNEAQLASPPTKHLTWDGTRVTAATHRSGPAGVRLAALFAESAADLLTDPVIATVRECAAHDCVMLFVPVNPRRRWCSPARCGNRTRVARHYQRHKPT